MYAFYLIVAAISGIVECFVFSTMSASLIMKHARFLLISSVFHLICNIVLLKWIGASGFILANIIHMVVRITYNWRDIKQLPNAQTLDFWSVLPDMTFFTLLLVSLMITGLSGLVSYCLEFWSGGDLRRLGVFWVRGVLLIVRRRLWVAVHSWVLSFSNIYDVSPSFVVVVD
jgi:hypothetical protein